MSSATPRPPSASPASSRRTNVASQLLQPMLDRVKPLLDADESNRPFLRAYAIGFAATVIPSLVKVLLSLKRRQGSQVLLQLLKAIGKGFSPRGLALAFGISVGGAQWGESRVEGVVRRAYLSALHQVQARRKSQQAKIESMEDAEEAARKETAKHEAIIKALSTFVSATVASLVSITLLQSRRSRSSRQAQEPDLALGFSPYEALSGPQTGPTPILPRPRAMSRRPAVQSPTLDLTLFIFVRAADVLVRGIYEATAVTSGRWGSVVSFIASHADTLVFWASCWRIMWCWFYAPLRLPDTYNRWILKLARMDPRLLRLLQYARKGEYVYGQRPNEEVALMCEEIAAGIGREPSFVNPQLLHRLDCSVVHGHVGRGTCEANAVKRWIAAFRDCLLIYLPVHLVPQLLFNMRTLTSRPIPSVIHILLAASRSSAFLATFVASIYASVCLVRTRIPLAFLPNVSPQVWDSGLCTGLGCFLCGFSVLIENKRRRREMSLYVVPRALYATMEEIVPRALLYGQARDLLARWAERSIFALSTGTVIAAARHRPELLSGVVRGVVGYAVGETKGKRAGTSK